VGGFDATPGASAGAGFALWMGVGTPVAMRVGTPVATVPDACGAGACAGTGAGDVGCAVACIPDGVGSADERVVDAISREVAAAEASAGSGGGSAVAVAAAGARAGLEAGPAP